MKLNPQRPVRPKGELQQVENESKDIVKGSKEDEGEDTEEGEEIDAEEESMKHKEVRAPGQPTKAEREQHELTPIPFRSWCVHCVRGRGKSAHHLKRTEEKEDDESIPPTPVVLDDEDIAKEEYNKV